MAKDYRKRELLSLENEILNCERAINAARRESPEKAAITIAALKPLMLELWIERDTLREMSQ